MTGQDALRLLCLYRVSGLSTRGRRSQRGPRSTVHQPGGPQPPLFSGAGHRGITGRDTTTDEAWVLQRRVSMTGGDVMVLVAETGKVQEGDAIPGKNWAFPGGQARPGLS